MFAPMLSYTWGVNVPCNTLSTFLITDDTGLDTKNVLSICTAYVHRYKYFLQPHSVDVVLQSALVVRRETPGVLNLRKNYFHFRWSNSFLNIHQQVFQLYNPIGGVLQKLIITSSPAIPAYYVSGSVLASISKSSTTSYEIQVVPDNHQHSSPGP